MLYRRNEARDIFSKLYDKKLLKEIKKKFTYDSTADCILRALASDSIDSKDVKYLNISGKGGLPPTEAYILINIIRHKNICKVVSKESGASYQRLTKNNICIKNGKGTITEFWVCS